MAILNIKTQNNYYLYNTLKKQYYGSNSLMHSVIQYLDLKSITINQLKDTDIDEISKVENIKSEYILEAIDRLSFLFKLDKKENTIIDTITISENDIMNSISNIKQIIIEVTENCNFHCDYCCYGDLYKNVLGRKKNMDIEKCIHALKQLISFQNSIHNISAQNNLIISFYGGEPLVHFEGVRKIVKFLNTNQSARLSISYSMTTNGYYLDKYIDFLIENDFKITISLDGDKCQNSYRKDKAGKSTFDEVYGNIIEIKNAYPDYYRKNIGFISVLHDANDPKSLYLFFDKLQKEPYLTALSKDDVKLERKDDFDRMYNSGEFRNSELEYIKERVPQLYNKVIEQTYSMENQLFSLKNKWMIFRDNYCVNKRLTGSCYLFQSKIFLSVSGFIYPCEKVNRKYAFGTFDNGELCFFKEKIECFYDEIVQNSNKNCLDCFVQGECERCYFSEPYVFEDCKACKKSKEGYCFDLIKGTSYREKKIEDIFK